MENKNKNLNPESYKSKYLMTKDKSDLISILAETINDLFSCYGDNIKWDSVTAQIFVKSKPDGDFEESDMQKIDDEVQDCLKYSENLKINNWKSENENDGFKDIYSIKILFQAEKTNGEKLSFEIRVRKNKHEYIIIEKLNHETGALELVQSKVALGGFAEGIVYVITDITKDIIGNLNYKRQRYSNLYDDNYNYFYEEYSEQIKTGSIVNLILNHTGKITLFLLSLVVLGVVWYLNLVSLWFCLISLSVCFILFVALAIYDQKKEYSKSQEKYGLIFVLVLELITINKKKTVICQLVK